MGREEAMEIVEDVVGRAVISIRTSHVFQLE